MLGVFVAKKSGGHLNPAVTLANCVYRRFPWHKLPIYAFAQVLGAMLGAMVVYLNYVSAIDVFEGGIDVRTVGHVATSTAGVFATYPVLFLSTKGQFFSEFLTSAILMFCLFALVDAGVGNMLPIFLVFLIYGLGSAFGWETGYAMNMARDFGPRLVSYSLGYGTGVFTFGNNYFWVCWLRVFYAASVLHELTETSRFRLWPPLSGHCSADCCTMSSYTPGGEAPSTHHGHTFRTQSDSRIFGKYSLRKILCNDDFYLALDTSSKRGVLEFRTEIGCRLTWRCLVAY